MNSKLGNSSGIGPLHDQDGNLLFDDKAKAELLNQYFHSVFISDNGILPHFPSRFKFYPQNLNDVTFDIPDIIKILKKLKTNSAAGPDNLPPVFYNKTAHNIAYPLKQLFRTFIDSRTLPQEWKNSIITPKFKKGLSTDPANYRPIIALTCSACKVLESLITSSLIQFLTDHNLISPSQHGFLKKHSTTTNLLSSLRDWTISLSNHKSTHICYIDFQRAFDTISHTKLIQNLFILPVTGSLEISFSGSKPSSLIATNVSVSTPHNPQTYLSSVEFPRVVSWVQSSSIFLSTISRITSQMMSEPNSLLTISNCIQIWT